MFVSAAGAPPRRVRRVRRVSAGAAAIAVAGLVSTGCAAGQIAQTADQHAAIDGVNVSVGTMDLRIVAIQAPPGLRTNYPKGSSAALKVVFVNNDRTPDRLVDIRTDAAGGWAAYRSYNDAFNVVEGTLTTPTASASASASGSESASDSASESTSESAPATQPPSGSSSGSSSASSSESGRPTTSAAPTTTAPTTTTPTGVQSVTIPSGGRVGFGTPEATGGLVLERLTRILRPAQTVTVTFTFANAGSVAVPVTVQIGNLGRTASVGPEGQEEGG